MVTFLTSPEPLAHHAHQPATRGARHPGLRDLLLRLGHRGLHLLELRIICAAGSSSGFLRDLVGVEELADVRDERRLVFPDGLVVVG
jgi:hypothetical protein